MKKKKEQEERKARAMAEVKNSFSFLSFIPCRLKSITAMLPYETFLSRPTQLFPKPPLKSQQSHLQIRHWANLLSDWLSQKANIKMSKNCQKISQSPSRTS